MICQELMATQKKGSAVMVYKIGERKEEPTLLEPLLGKTLLTVSLFTANINTQIFTAWVEQDLLPKLPPKSVIVMDNAAFHKNQNMQGNIRNAGHILEYLPPYSPDLNPIETKWAQSKNLRKRKQCAMEELFQLNHL